MSFRSMIVGVCMAIGASSCLKHVAFTGQELQLRYDAKSDVAEALLIYRGVMATDDVDAGVADSECYVQAMLGRRRYFVLGEWPLEFDLDADAKDPLSIAGMQQGGLVPSGAAARLIEFCRGIRIDDAGLFKDGDRRLCLYQRVKLPQFSTFVKAANAYLAAMILQSNAPCAPDDFFFDEWTRNAWVERAKRGEPWVGFSEQSLEVDLPMSAKAAGDFARSFAAPKASAFMRMLASVSQIELRAGGARARWVPDATGVFRFELGPPGNLSGLPWKSALADRLRSHGFDGSRAPKLEQVRQLLEH